MNPDRSLASKLTYTPQELRFGTSGRRGEVIHLTQLEVYINALAEVKYLQTLPPEDGGVAKGDPFFFAYDLRPSSTTLVEEQQCRGQLAQTIARAIRDAGMQPVNLGCLPTPALSYYALREKKGSIMVTGSHIPFDRNGYKLNTSAGELLKQHEAPIQQAVTRQRERIYHEPFEISPFNENGFFKDGVMLPEQQDDGASVYLARYLDFFSGASLSGMRLLVYQHSAVGRDLLLDLLRAFGADVTAAGRSTEFVPIDTENIDAAQLAAIQKVVDDAGGEFDAVVSTDGDSDRPLMLGVQGGKVSFFGGDLLGMVVASYLKADAVVVPISCNDAIDRGSLASILRPKTRIGSPFVIAGMEEARRAGKRVVCGWEANGGFLLGSAIHRDGKTLSALPTRDAFLPILCTLFSAREQGVSLHTLFESVGIRFSRAGLLKNFPRPVSMRIMERFTPATAPGDSESIREDLCRFFTAQHGFDTISHLNYVDGVRIVFSNGEIAHLRPSGNADELRIYAVADSAERAKAIINAALAEPDGILRRLEEAVVKH